MGWRLRLRLVMYAIYPVFPQTPCLPTVLWPGIRNPTPGCDYLWFTTRTGYACWFDHSAHHLCKFPEFGLEDLRIYGLGFTDRMW